MNDTVRFQHGRLSIELPPDWHDQTTLLFIGPPAEALSAPLAGQTPATFRTNVTVSVEAADQFEDAKSFLEVMHEQLMVQGLQFEILETKAFAAGPHSGWSILRRLEMDGVLVRQRTVAFKSGELFVVATSSSEESSAETSEPSLGQILSSLRFR